LGRLPAIEVANMGFSAVEATIVAPAAARGARESTSTCPAADERHPMIGA
jgi:hypothetical protein